MVNDSNYSLMTIYEADITSKKLNINKVVLLLILLVAILCATIAIYSVVKSNNKYNETISAMAMQEEQNTQGKKEQEEHIKQEETTKEVKEIIKLTQEGRENLTNIYNSETKRAFLTFDDGPSINTPGILEILEQENIKATFFVLGSQVEKMPEIAKAIYEKGHFIASHGYSHIYSQIYSSSEAVLGEYNASMEIIRNAIGEPGYNAHLFRFPGGLVGGKYEEIKNQAKELLSQNDILCVDWNALNGDGEKNQLTSEFEMNRLIETIGEKNSVVILMHDAQAKTVTKDTLPQIISYLREQGYEFNSFYDIIK